MFASRELLSLESSQADRLVAVAEKEVGVSIKKNPERVLWYLSSVNIKYLTNYCAAFVRKMLDEAGIDFRIRSALARKYVAKNSVKARDVWAGKISIPKASLAIWFRTTSKWQGHIGITREKWNGKKGKTVEGNTSDNNTREGGNVELKNRTIEPYNYFRIEYFTVL